jgi:hypothetical protein
MRQSGSTARTASYAHLLLPEAAGTASSRNPPSMLRSAIAPRSSSSRSRRTYVGSCAGQPGPGARRKRKGSVDAQQRPVDPSIRVRQVIPRTEKPLDKIAASGHGLSRYGINRPELLLHPTLVGLLHREQPRHRPDVRPSINKRVMVGTLCRAAGYADAGFSGAGCWGWPCCRGRHNQRLSRKARSGSGGGSGLGRRRAGWSVRVLFP